MREAILFDLDGVLVDTYDVWVELVRGVAQRLGYPEIPREVFVGTWGQGIEKDIEMFFPRHTIEEIRGHYVKHFGDHLHLMKVMDGADRVLRGIELPKAVVTNSPSVLARQALAVAQLEGHFREVVGSDNVAHSKPAPDLIFEACRRLGVVAERTLLVGDSRFDEEAARAAGSEFVMFRSFAELKL